MLDQNTLWGRKRHHVCDPYIIYCKGLGDNLTWWNFEFWGHHGVLRPFFRGRKAKTREKSVLQALEHPKNVPQKNFRPWSILWKKNLRCAIIIGWDILKNFLLFFFVPSRYFGIRFAQKRMKSGLGSEKHGGHSN